MIFDSERMSRLRERYNDIPDYAIPEVLLLDRHDDYSGERLYLETLALSVPAHKQKSLINTFIQTDVGSHIGAWFELMLYGWLKESCLGLVEIEPERERHYPDFLINVNNQEIIIEAKAFQIAYEKREHEKSKWEVIASLRQVNRAYALVIEELVVGSHISTEELQQEVEIWLEVEPETPFCFANDSGYRIHLTSISHDDLDHVVTIGPTVFEYVNPEPLKEPLSSKAKQHRRIRRAGYPYVIAVYIESSFLSAEEVAEAWFGRPPVIIDQKTLRVLDERLGRSGLHYFGSEILHRSVSGTLVFKSFWSEQFQGRQLNAWYIQNPYFPWSDAFWCYPYKPSLRLQIRSKLCGNLCIFVRMTNEHLFGIVCHFLFWQV